MNPLNQTTIIKYAANRWLWISLAFAALIVVVLFVVRALNKSKATTTATPKPVPPPTPYIPPTSTPPYIPPTGGGVKPDGTPAAHSSAHVALGDRLKKTVDAWVFLADKTRCKVMTDFDALGITDLQGISKYYKSKYGETLYQAFNSMFLSGCDDNVILFTLQSRMKTLNL